MRWKAGIECRTPAFQRAQKKTPAMRPSNLLTFSESEKQMQTTTKTAFSKAQSFGDELTARDLENLARSYITPALAQQAGIRRVDSITGAEIVGRKPKASIDYAGLIFPYYLPGNMRPREYRLRRDYPDLEQQPDQSIKEENKYLSPPGRSNLLYFPPNTPAEWLGDSSIPSVLTEGEKKALALHRFYSERGEQVLVIALPGVWNWRGIVGKTTDDNGARRDVKGVILDFDRINWHRREVKIVFDTNVQTNGKVRAARRELTKELRQRSADVLFVDLPAGIPSVNGVDDLLALKGADFVARLFDSHVVSPSDDVEPWEPPAAFHNYTLPGFPADALPDWQRCFAAELATATQTPTAVFT